MSAGYARLSTAPPYPARSARSAAPATRSTTVSADRAELTLSSGTLETCVHASALGIFQRPGHGDFSLLSSAFADMTEVETLRTAAERRGWAGGEATREWYEQ